MSDVVSGLNSGQHPAHQRTRQIAPGGTTSYLHADNAGGLLYEKETKSTGVLEHRYFIAAAGAPFLLMKNVNGVATPLYQHRDALGSVTAITNSAGAVIERFGYEPLGKRRVPNGAADPNSTLTGVNTDRGFTNHEHLDEMALVHMNGRVYDPTIGLFMSADPFVQDSDGLQTYNRYSYVTNNPLTYADPSGYFFKRIGRELHRWEKDFRHEIRRPNSLLGSAIQITATVVGTVACEGQVYCGIAIATAVSGTVARAQGVTGSDLLRTTAISGGTALALYGVGNTFDVGSFGNYAGHAAVGCASAAAGGGNCGQGAAAGFVGVVATVNTSNIYVNTAIASVAGGTASVITGGKFANGAVLGAYGYLFNEAVHAVTNQRSKLGRPLTADERTLYAQHFPEDLLSTVQVYDGKVPWWLRSDMDGITLGNKVYFRAGIYVPDTAPGVEILGHEIKHVQQYANGMSYADYIWNSRGGYANNPYEIEAYAKGAAIRSSYCGANAGKFGC